MAEHRQAKVFIVEPVRSQLDVSTAAKYGTPTFIFGRDARRCSIFKHDEYGAAVLSRLQELSFDADTDSLCIVGNMVAVVVAMVAIAQVYDEFNVLLFSASDEAYVQRRFNSKHWEAAICQIR